MAEIPVDMIVMAVAQQAGVTRAELRNPDERSRFVSRARSLAWLLIARLRPDMSTTNIGRRVGGRTCSTVHRGICRAEAMLAAGAVGFVEDLAEILRDLDIAELPPGGADHARARARADLEHRLYAADRRRRELVAQLAALDGASA